MTTTINADTTNGVKITSDTSGILGLQTNGNTAVTIDGSQNVGIGVTPSAWTNYKAIQLGGGSLSSYSDNNYIELSQNGYYASGVYKYVNTGYASKYQQNTGTHQWYVAASGTAGNTVSFTQAMTLGADGNMILGGTSPTTSSGYTSLSINNATNSGYLVLQSNGTNKSDWYVSGGTVANLRGVGVPLVLSATGANYLSLETNGSERVRINSSGSLLIGTTTGGSDVAKVYIEQATDPGTVSYKGLMVRSADSKKWVGAIGVNADGNMTFSQSYEGAGGAFQSLAFYTSNTERVRIDTSGSLLVGVTSGSYHTLAKDIASNWSTEIRNSNANPYGLYLRFSGAAPNGSVNEFLYCGDTVGQKMAIRSNGGIANFSGSNVNLSDRREKTNFAPAKSYLNVICAIPVQTFNYIDQDMKDDGGLTLGVVAQDVQAVAPELVMESNWANKNEEPKMRLSIYQTDLQFALMKCIQEQQALITQLQADVAALKGA